MKINAKKLFTAMILIGAIFFESKVQAASASISSTKTTATTGESVTINVNVNAAAWNLRVSGNGISGDSIVGYDSDGNNTSVSRSFTLNTSSAGTYTISLSGDVTDGVTDANSSINKSVTVTVTNPAPVTPSGGGSSGGSSSSNSGQNSSSGSGNTTPSPKPNNTTKPAEVKKSNDATLKSLQVEGLELYPEFNSSVNEYNVKVANDINSVKIIAETNNSKASYIFEGTYEGLIVGENIANVVVTAEDGTTNTYVIRINKERKTLKLQMLKISYFDETGSIVEITPNLQENVFNYNLENIPYYVEGLNLQVLSNLENAKIEIMGNNDLYEGENTITVILTMPSESEELEDEELKYTFTVNKEVAPKVTIIGKIENWFKNITGTIVSWYTVNQFRIVIGALMLCSAALGGLSVYLCFAYKKYQGLVKKLAELTKIDAETVNTQTVLEGLSKKDNTSVDIEVEETKEVPKSRGRHF